MISRKLKMALVLTVGALTFGTLAVDPADARPRRHRGRQRAPHYSQGYRHRDGDHRSRRVRRRGHRRVRRDGHHRNRYQGHRRSYSPRRSYSTRRSYIRYAPQASFGFSFGYVRSRSYGHGHDYRRAARPYYSRGRGYYQGGCR
jgi:hypothetical protein